MADICERLERLQSLVSEEAYHRVVTVIKRPPNYYRKDNLYTEHFTNESTLRCQLMQNRVKIPRSVNQENYESFLRSILTAEADFDLCRQVFLEHLETRLKDFVGRSIAKKQFFNYTNLDIDITLACPYFVLLDSHSYQSILRAQQNAMISKLLDLLYMRFFHYKFDSTPRNVTKDNYREYLSIILRRDYSEWKEIPFEEIATVFYNTLSERRGWN